MIYLPKLTIFFLGNFQDVIPVFLPLFHIYGMVGIFLNFFAKGCKLILVPTFIGSQFIKILQLYQPTLLFAVPQMSKNLDSAIPHLIFLFQL